MLVLDLAEDCRESRPQVSRVHLTWVNSSCMSASREIISRGSHDLSGCAVQHPPFKREARARPNSAAPLARADLSSPLSILFYVHSANGDNDIIILDGTKIGMSLLC